MQEGEKRTRHIMTSGGHTETLQIDYDPSEITYEELLDVFWDSHDPTLTQKTQYKSIIFYHQGRK